MHRSGLLSVGINPSSDSYKEIAVIHSFSSRNFVAQVAVDEKFVYALDLDAGLVIVDIRSLETTHAVVGFSELMAIDGNHVYVANVGRLTVVNTETMEVNRIVTRELVHQSLDVEQLGGVLIRSRGWRRPGEGNRGNLLPFFHSVLRSVASA